MGRVRPFVREDIPRIIELNVKLFPGSAGLTPDVQRRNFEEICFNNPWKNEGMTSLVYEESDGTIVGFLGVIPRLMSMNGKSIRVAVGQHLMVDRATLASLQLFKALLEGPQDFTMADMAVDVTKTIWERLGGEVSLLHSLYWIRPLRPGSFIKALFAKRNPKSSIASVPSPLTRAADMLASLIPLSPFHHAEPESKGENLDPRTLLRCMEEFNGETVLKPSYDERSLAWLLETQTREKRFGTFQKVLVKGKDGSTLGWYLYHLLKNGRSQVLQIGATAATIDHVLAHLFYNAWQGGSVELLGRVDPRFMKPLSENHCLFFPGRNWMLVHSRSPEITRAIDRGNVFLTRLEGDLWFF